MDETDENESANQDETASISLDEASDRPSRIGPYRILQKLGEGGMGIVYQAEQRDPIRRTVALKLIKAGMDTAQVVARFESERQALAMMDHPGIARVYDAGSTDHGRPYFVMEYVKGEPITTYCDRNRLNTSERLSLFGEVCQAVHHAHQKGIIHRDLKPSNVLVASDEGKPVPKIIDFGVAKATQQRLTERTLFTQFGAMVGTPEYMSPEQAEMGPVDVDTRTDVYSLGVLLYELLVGALPFDSKELRRAGYAEICRRIREDDPSRPSTRFTTLGDQSREFAKSRRTDVRTLHRDLRGDLDWIVMKALAKEPGRRYGSTSEFAEDVRRHLSHEPVNAGPPSARYRAGKFVRRHRIGVGVAATSAVLIVAIAILMVVQGRRIAHERDRANQEALASQRVSDYLANMLGSVDQYRLGQGLASILQERLEASIQEEGLSDEEADLVLTSFSQAMERISATDAAIELLDKEIMARAAETLEQKLAEDPLIAARIHHTLGLTYWKLGRYDAAEGHALEAIEIRGRVLGEDAPQTLRSRWLLASIYRVEGHYDLAEPIYRETIEKQRTVLGEDHARTLQSRVSLGWLLVRISRNEEAEVIFSEVLESNRRVLGDTHPNTLGVMAALGNSYHETGRAEEAAALLGEVARSWDATHEPDESQRFTHSLARVYVSTGRVDEAVAMLEEFLERSRRVKGEDHPATFFPMHSLAWAYSAQGSHAEAMELGLEVVEKRREVLGPDHPRTLASAINLARIYLGAGQLGDAENLAEDCVRRYRAVYGDVHRRTANALSSLARSYTRQGKYDEAENVRREILDVYRALEGDEHPRTLFAMNNVGFILYSQGSYEEAVSILEETLKKRRAVLGDADTNTLWTMTTLSAAMSFRDQCGDAAVLAREALTLIDREHDGQHPGRLTLMEALADCLPEDDVSENDRTLLAEHLSERRSRAEAPEAASWVKNLYAWYLLTTPARELRDPGIALEVALEANEMDRHTEPWHLDTLALAYHDTGDSRRAVEIQRGALLLVPEDDAEMRAELEQRLAEFEEALKRDSADSP